MKQILIFIFTFLGTTFLTAQSQDSIKKSLIIGEVRTIKSKLLNEDRILNIYLPLKYDATKSYPVIYLLDGSMDEDFLHLTGLVQFFNMQFKMPDFIVVGVANVDRKRDFTFHTDLKDLQKEYPTTGHSDVFIKFIEEELQPFIRENYHTNETKYIIGQSLGGLLATEILLKKPTLFSHYLIVSPSLWWDNESLLKEAKSLIEKQTDGNLYVYISVGNGEAKIMQRDATELFKLFKDANKKSTVLDFKLMMDENHATILHNSIYQAFLKLFPFKE
jgi:predicted alpha/beta superfamily hydrolase